MDFEKLCFESNKKLLEFFIKDFNISIEELEAYLKLVAKHDVLLNMATQVNKMFKTNPKACINFGEYGEKVANDLKIDKEYIYKAVLSCGYNELLINIANQLKDIYKKNKS